MKILNSNGCQCESTFERGPISQKKSFHTKEVNGENLKIVSKEISLLDSSEDTEKMDINIHKRETSSKRISRYLDENNEITNYFKSSLSNMDKEILYDVTKESNGAKIEVGKYMKKINFFDESDGFLQNEQFID